MPMKHICFAVALSAIQMLSFAQVPSWHERDCGRERVSHDPNDWPMFNHDAQGSRFNRGEWKLSTKSVRHLQQKWMYRTAGDVYATPVVVDDIVYAGDSSGTVYALTRSGELIWQTAVNAPITASALVINRMVIVGDQSGYLHGLDRWDGRILWSVRPNVNKYAAFYGSPVWVGGEDGDVVVGVSSNEDLYGLPNPNYSCCHFRGQVVRLHANDGRIVWQTYLISAEDSAKGIAGSSVWATPTYDKELRTVYITTGNCYPGPGCSNTSDSFLALNVDTGAIIWKHQLVAHDIEMPEADFGDSPQVYTVKGRKVVGAGEKYTGVYSVLDARTGEIVEQNQAVPSCPNSNGLFADSAIDHRLVFVNGEDCTAKTSNPLAPVGVVAALAREDSKKVWDISLPEGPVFSGLAVANGVVYFQVSNIPGSLYAVNAESGEVLAQLQVSGGISGPSVSRGQVYLGTGTAFATKIQTGTPFPSTAGIVAFGVPSECDEDENDEYDSGSVPVDNPG
jgi:polyvinyl alcohol dehydrogenase (cytochrome)